MADVKKAGLLGAALVGGVSVAASAQEFMTQDEIAAMVESMQGGNSGGSVSVGGGGGGGGGTVASGDVTGGGDMQIGGTTGTAIADASGGDSNIAFVS
jgi:hypothetical protein